MIHGLIPVNKEKGMSSHAVVERIRKIFKMKKVGHFGTLDPATTGILLLALGHATKFFNFYIGKKKTYSGLIHFGYATTTYDSEGEPLSAEKEIDLERIAVGSLLAEFIGVQMQLPPLFSAKKFKGKPLYVYARNGEPVARKPVQIEIFELEAKVVDGKTLWFRVCTSAGTYIRTLAHDIGQRVGVGAFLKELHREQIGEFNVTEAFLLDEVKAQIRDQAMERVVIPIEALLPEFAKIIVSPAGRRAVLNGMLLPKAEVLKIYRAESKDYFRLFDDAGKLLAIARKDPSSASFKPQIVFPD